MVQRRVVHTLSDLSESPSAQTVTFGLDGVHYEVDLTAEETTQLAAVLAPYIDAGRRVTKRGKPVHRTAVAPSPATVREWALANGVDCPRMGRVPRHVMEQFNAAH